MHGLDPPSTSYRNTEVRLTRRSRPSMRRQPCFRGRSCVSTRQVRERPIARGVLSGPLATAGGPGDQGERHDPGRTFRIASNSESPAGHGGVAVRFEQPVNRKCTLRAKGFLGLEDPTRH